LDLQRTGVAKKAEKTGVLSDHRRIGKRFVPPWVDQFPQLAETPWVDGTLPELFWIAWVHKKAGFARGTELAANLSMAAAKSHPSGLACFASNSSYEALCADEKKEVVRRLRLEDVLTTSGQPWLLFITSIRSRRSDSS
jgi:hypothetical protein